MKLSKKKKKETNKMMGIQIPYKFRNTQTKNK